MFTDTKSASDITDLIGGTPVLELHKITWSGMSSIFAKLESFNPSGSVKDRIALNMIEDAEKKGFLHSGGTIIEPTGGNTGIGLAMVGALKGYEVVLVMPESIGFEKKSILESLGAKLEFTDSELGMQGAIEKAQQIVSNHPNFYMPQQFSNPANPEIHRNTTARELIKSMAGKKIDAFVSGVGTGGTITGVGEVLKSKHPDIEIVAVEPRESAVLSGGKPGPHDISGIGAGFIPKILNTSIIDTIIPVSSDDAYHTTRLLAEKEGIFVGLSSGAACFAAMEVAERLGRDSNVAVLFPDPGDRYVLRENLVANR